MGAPMTKPDKGIILAAKKSAKGNGGCDGCKETAEKLLRAIELLAQIVERTAVPPITMIAAPGMPDCPGTADGVWVVKIKRVSGVCSSFADPV